MCSKFIWKQDSRGNERSQPLFKVIYKPSCSLAPSAAWPEDIALEMLVSPLSCDKFSSMLNEVPSALPFMLCKK